MKIMIQTILKGCSAELIAVGQGTDPYYYWTPGAGLDYTTKDTVTASPSVTTKYYVFSSSADTNIYSCCSKPDSVVVKVIDSSQACFNCGWDYVCLDDGVFTTPQVLQAVPITHASYQWQVMGMGCSGYTDIAGATSDSYTVTAFTYCSYLCCFTVNNIFRVKITDTLSGCTFYSNEEVIFEQSCRMEEKVKRKTEKLLIYPNPTEGLFTVEVNSEDNVNALVTVFNQMGQKAFERNIEFTIGQNKIQLQFADNMADGIYHVKVSDGRRQFNGSLIKNRD